MEILGWPKSFFGFFYYILRKAQMKFLANPINGRFAFKNPIPSLSTSALQDLWVLPLECSCAGPRGQLTVCSPGHPHALHLPRGSGLSQVPLGCTWVLIIRTLGASDPDTDGATLPCNPDLQLSLPTRGFLERDFASELTGMQLRPLMDTISRTGLSPPGPQKAEKQERWNVPSHQEGRRSWGRQDSRLFCRHQRSPSTSIYLCIPSFPLSLRIYILTQHQT